MKIEEKLKAKYLYSSKSNFFKSFYFIFQYLKFKLKPRIINANWGIDMIVNDIFKNKKQGVFIDVGCHHPFINNNTYLFYKKGWRGINIDLDYNSIDMFNHFRPKDYNMQKAISKKKGLSDFYFFHNRAPKNTISKQSGKGAKIIKKIETDTLDNIIKKSNIKMKRIDFLSIDVEGNELNVLKGLNFKRYEPKIVVLEFIDPRIKEFYYHKIEKIMRSELYKFMKKKKYNLVNWVHDDLMFISKN